jgi:hypothetical protein
MGEKLIKALSEICCVRESKKAELRSKIEKLGNKLGVNIVVVDDLLKF